MADGKQDYAFVHMTLKIGHGRTLESRQQVGEMLFALIKEHFAALMAQRYWRSLSLWKSWIRC